MHYLIQVRDTLHYTLENQNQPADVFNKRKQILLAGIEPNSHLGSFLENNKETGAKVKEKINEFISEIYGDDSTILVVKDDIVRVDHTQNIKILDYVVGISESIRDIIFGYLTHARANNVLEENILSLAILEDRFYRVLLNMIALREFQKSFIEFQKVMGESKGKPSPQSNYIVQNELQKLSAMIRFVRNHNHCTDNKTLDLLDAQIALIEMTEGRRDRRDDKSFKDLFEESAKAINAYVAELEPKWNELFNKNLNEFLADLKAEQENKQA
jgi:hypothetical protein